MDEGCVERRAHQLVAVLRGDVDEIAEHIVVPDLERLARRCRRRSAPEAAAMTLRDSSRSARDSSSAASIAVADEAAVALEQRKLVGEGPRPAPRPAPGRVAAAPSSQPAISAGVSASASRRLASCRAVQMPSRIAARSRGPPRPTTSRDSERDRSGAAWRSCAGFLAGEGVADENVRRCRGGAPIVSGSVSGAASRCASSREPADVTVRSIEASSEPRRSPASVRVSSRFAARRLVDRQASRPAPRGAAATAAAVCRAACARHR